MLQQTAKLNVFRQQFKVWYNPNSYKRSQKNQVTFPIRQTTLKKTLGHIFVVAQIQELISSR
jgi:hypothetical protein